MKKIFIVMLFIFICVKSIAQQNNQLSDGLYLADKVLNDAGKVILNKNQVLIPFNRDFIENAPNGATYLVVNTSDFVPLVLEEEPVLFPQSESKKKLQLTFSRLASEKLEKFTTENVKKQVALVVNGEALTVNEIRDAIHHGKLEITRGNDNACHRLYVVLKDRIEK